MKKQITLILSILVISLSVCFSVYGNETPKLPLEDTSVVQEPQSETPSDNQGGYETPQQPIEDITSSTKAETTKPAKKANTFKVKAKKPVVKYKNLKKKKQTIALKKAMTVSGVQGTVTYKLSSAKKGKKNVKKYFKVAKNGKITVKKGLKKGTYTVKIKVSAAGNAEYNAAVKTVTVKIKVK